MPLRPEDFEAPYRDGSGADPAPLAGLLAGLRRQRGWERRLRGARIHEHWLQIAGEQLAANVVPVRLSGGVLVLRASSAAWATQVRYLSAQLAERANEVLGEGSVSRVTITTGGSR